jgi:ribosomal protein L1
MSRITQAQVTEAIQAILKDKKQRKFVETVEL